jgi:outer membrane biosynthesis protein TonB
LPALHKSETRSKLFISPSSGLNGTVLISNEDKAQDKAKPSTSPSPKSDKKIPPTPAVDTQPSSRPITSPAQTTTPPAEYKQPSTQPTTRPKTTAPAIKQPTAHTDRPTSKPTVDNGQQPPTKPGVRPEPPTKPGVRPEPSSKVASLNKAKPDKYRGNKSKKIELLVPKKGFKTLSRRAITWVMKENQKKIQQCSKKAIIADPKIKGRIEVSFRIGLDGRVSDVRFLRNNVTNPIVLYCVLRVLQKSKFPPPSAKQGVVSVTYPFYFFANKT